MFFYVRARVLLLFRSSQESVCCGANSSLWWWCWIWSSFQTKTLMEEVTKGNVEIIIKACDVSKWFFPSTLKYHRWTWLNSFCDHAQTLCSAGASPHNPRLCNPSEKTGLWHAISVSVSVFLNIANIKFSPRDKWTAVILGGFSCITFYFLWLVWMGSCGLQVQNECALSLM